MNKNILDNIAYITKKDSKQMLKSLELVGRQVEDVVQDAKKLTTPSSYKKFKNIVFLGMGGSTLGSHVIKALYFSTLKIPVEIVNGYHIPNFVDKDSLVVVSSYSGTTEEPLAAMKEAKNKKAKLMSISSGGELASWSKKNKIPVLIFDTKNNPCGSPRMGLGYSIVGQILLLAKVGALSFSPTEISSFIKTLNTYENKWGVNSVVSKNFAKQLAADTSERSVWYVGSEHLGGNVHIGANQMNENAKRFAGYFLIPELNHHLLEGGMFPKSNTKNVLFVLLESGLYDKKVQKRYEITKQILTKNKISFQSYKCVEKNALNQVAELLVLTSYTSFYSAILEGIDPTAIPFVDFFKQQLKK